MPDSTEIPIFDSREFMERLDGDWELAEELVDMFAETYRDMINEVAEAIKEGNVSDLERAAHGLKGAMSNFAAKRATKTAYELEKLGRAGNLDEAPQRLKKLKLEVDQVKSALDTFMADNSA